MKQGLFGRMGALALAIALGSGVPRAGAESYESVTVPRGPAWEMSAGASMAVGQNTGNPGFVVGMAAPLRGFGSVYAGAEVGSYFLAVREFGMALMLLPSLTLQFPRTMGIQPYLGLMTGFVWSFGERGASRVRLGTFLRPGLRFPLARTVDVHTELRLGAVGETYFLLPGMGATFRL